MSSPVTRNSISLVDAKAGKVSVTRGTKGASPGFLDPDDPAVRLLERRTVRKQRGGMSVAGKPHQHEIEQRMRRIEPIAPVEALEFHLVAPRRQVRAVCIRGDRVNGGGGSVDATEEQASRHAHIAVGMVPRHEAVIAHEPVHAIPRQFAAIRFAR